MKLLIPLIFFLLSITKALSQNITIAGKVIDKNIKQALPGVSIKINNLGFITDKNGSFSFSVNKELVQKFPIKFSYVGYKQETINNPEDFSFYLIELAPVAKELEEVIIYSDAIKIIKKAISRIPENYSTQLINVTGFQRTYEQINDSDYFLKNDALLKIYTPSYGSNKEKIQVSLIQNRSVLINNFDSATEKKEGNIHNWIGSLITVSNSDHVFNKMKSISPKNLNDFKYTLKSKTFYNNIRVFAIDFIEKKQSEKYSSGTIFIDTISYAFVGFYNLIGAEIFDQHKSAKKYKHTFSLQKVFYDKNVDGKWYLNNLHMEQRVVQDNKIGGKIIGKIIIDYVTLSIDSINVSKIPNRERLKKKDGIIDFVKPGIIEWDSIDSDLRKQNLLKYITELPIPVAKQIKL